LRSLNNQLAVHPKIMKKLKDNYNIYFELFGSVLNTYNRYYCSLFYDIEKYFGSMGSFFDIELLSGKFSMNPPFDNRLMGEAVNKIETTLNDNKDITVFIWIPIWDKKGRINVYKQCDNLSDEEIQIKKEQFVYPEYMPMKTINKSKFTKSIEVICRTDITYYDYQYYYKKWVADTYLIIMSNNKINYDIHKLLKL
jgi:hypothetical protein